MIARMVFYRLVHSVLTLFLVSIVLFAGTEILPGDTAEIILGMEATPENVAAMRKRLGLDRSAPVRYFEWLGNMLRGDFGTSLAAATSTEKLVNSRIRNSAVLGISVAVIAIPIAVALGLLAAMLPAAGARHTSARNHAAAMRPSEARVVSERMGRLHRRA